MGYVIITKTNVSRRKGINSRCRRFGLLLFTVVAQCVATMTAVVAAPAGHWRAIVAGIAGSFTECPRGDSVPR